MVPSTLHQSHPRVFRRICFFDFPAAICRSVINKNQLEILLSSRCIVNPFLSSFISSYPSTHGMARWMVVPLPRALSIVMRMSCCSAIQVAMERPRPVPLMPSAFVRDVSTR